MSTKPPLSSLTRFLIGLVVVLGVLVVIALVQRSRADYLAYDARRTAWHQRCDQFVDKPLPADAAARAAYRSCAAELRAAVDEAKQKGWR